MMLSLYRFGSTILAPIYWLVLQQRRNRGKEDASRFAERIGYAERPRPPGRLVWVHGASVGESLSALPLIERLLDGDDSLHVVVTTGTVTSAQMLQDRLPPRAFHQFVPIDRAPWVRRFLRHWRPDAALWLESELWPNLLIETARANVPMVLINGRMSDRSFARWRRWPHLIGSMLRAFDLCLVQSAEDGKRFAALGARRVECPGNLKFTSKPLAADPDALDEMQSAVIGRPVWMAASTHAGEEKIVGNAVKLLKSAGPQPLCIVVPRHADRGDSIEGELKPLGLNVLRRSRGELPRADTDLYLADTMGELGIFYRLSSVVLVGGSLVPHGGQNPLEAAQLDCAILHGPHMGNFREITQLLDEAHATIVVRDAADLAAAVQDLFRHRQLRDQRAELAHQVVLGQQDVLERVMAALTPYVVPARQGTGTDARA
ncbi:MAG: 3-deoxy-D-manno-octulosonic acid transferase [Alphaproteobacteria bacterium]